jgi:hypothetical protein
LPPRITQTPSTSPSRISHAMTLLGEMATARVTAWLMIVWTSDAVS